jgi:hypothetical protein
MKDLNKSSEIEKELYRFIYYSTELKKCDKKTKMEFWRE